MLLLHHSVQANQDLLQDLVDPFLQQDRQGRPFQGAQEDLGTLVGLPDLLVQDYRQVHPEL